MEEFYSNCLLESIRYYIRYPKSTKIYKKGSWKLIWRKRQFPHFYWYNKLTEEHLHFEATYSDEPLIGQLWFHGSIKKFRYHN